jgi:hypothetical protein
MEEVVQPLPVDVLLKELTKDKFVRVTNNGENEIYIITHHDSPNVMREIGRLREVTFRASGGGTGKSVDIDEFDINEFPYKQIIVWNPKDKEIVGGYRYIKCKDAVDKNGKVHLATTELFTFSQKFMKDYLPKTIELGRSFVQPKYQPSSVNRKGLFSLDNIWDGLGAVIVDNPDIKYLFGKVTMYTHFNLHARDMILAFMNYYFPDTENIVVPIEPLPLKTDVSEFLKSIKGLPYKEGHHILNKNVRALGENIPPLVNSYMNISPSMKTFGTSMNSHFGDVEETGILVTIADMYESKTERHIKSYKK